MFFWWISILPELLTDCFRAELPLFYTILFLIPFIFFYSWALLCLNDFPNFLLVPNYVASNRSTNVRWLKRVLMQNTVEIDHFTKLSSNDTLTSYSFKFVVVYLLCLLHTALLISLWNRVITYTFITADFIISGLIYIRR